MSDLPLISILMPVRNAAPYLEACIESILGQTYSHWELLPVDDGSEDDSLALLERFAALDQRIRVNRHPGHRGIPAALRLAFSQSRGSLLTRMDADDCMVPQKLAQLCNLLQHNGPGHVATAPVAYFSDTVLGPGYLRYQNWLNDLMQTGRHYEDIYKECVLPSPCWMAFREDLLRCGAFVAATYPEDYDLCFRFYKAGYRIVAANEPLHFWRDHASRASRNEPQYANQSYFDLKLPYFLELDHAPDRPLVLWGAGKKGKQIAKRLAEKGISFHWVCDNPAKWGIRLFETELKDFRCVSEMVRPQLIIAVAAPDGQAEILRFLQQHTYRPGEDYFFFC
ncbi:MAG: glycosyltransferase family 2 protein [Saprospiraceae bacterium]|nr:glycosyltransferase family 2 protein [Saprospiraceae bacterium]